MLSQISDLIKKCPVCGSNSFSFKEVIWPELAISWELSSEEKLLVDIQQGFACNACFSSLRIMNLASAITKEFGYPNLILEDLVKLAKFKNLKILDINGLGRVSEILTCVKGYVRMDYPSIDLMNTSSHQEKYDLILHTDTLEHIPDPSVGIKNSIILLNANGRLIFNVPIVPSKLSRARNGLPPVYHGDESTKDNAYIVRYEFGYDFPGFIYSAGVFDYCVFSITGNHSFCYIIKAPNLKDDKSFLNNLFSNLNFFK
jgi:hypothetical protein